MYACVLVLPHLSHPKPRQCTLHSRVSAPPDEMSWVLSLLWGRAGGGVVCESSDSSLSNTVTVSSVLRQDLRMHAREFGSAQNGSTVCGRMHCFDKCNKHYVFHFCTFSFVQAQVRTYTRRLCTAHIREQCWIVSPISYYNSFVVKVCLVHFALSIFMFLEENLQYLKYSM